MEPKNEKRIVFSLLLAAVFLFFAFGYYHLTKFDTADEHLWRYERIKQYWTSIASHNWEKTYINDKPGVTVALFSGAGLLFEPSPENHLISDPHLNENNLFDLYDISKTDRINFLFRIPILIVSSLSLFAFFWLVYKAYRSLWLALFAVVIIATNPVLIGISQIINPDSFFWIFGGLSAFSFLALLNTQEKKFIPITGILTGFALLSKYTAVTLFLFYLLAIISKIIFEEKKKEGNFQYGCKMIFYEIIIFAVSIAVFSIFLPAVFVKPDYLIKGVSQFIEGKQFFIFALAVIIFGAAAFYFRNLIEKFLGFLASKKNVILIIASSLFLLVVFVIILNVWTDQKFIPFDKLRDAAYANEPKKFSFKPFLTTDNILLKNIKIFFLEPYSFIFSLSPLSLLLLVFIFSKAIFKKISASASAAAFSMASFFILYFVATVYAGVVTNVRYSILLYPLFSLLFAIAIFELAKSLAFKNKNTYVLISILILFLGSITLWSIRPFYFGYANFMLPKKFTVTQSWGHGSYEAAQYLNSLPNAKNKIIWSSTNTLCPFFEGKCLNKRKLDLNMVKPDYFVISKRGELKADRGFIFVNPDFKGKNSSYYYENLKTNYEWSIFLDDRPENFIKIVKFEN